MRIRNVMTMTAAMAVVLALGAQSQPLDAPSTDPAAGKPARTAAAGGQPALRAQLVDQQKKAAKREATVKTEAENINIVDPAASGEKARSGEGHFHYQVDDGPVIATTASKLSFHELERGEHAIKVTLAGNDHAPVAPPVALFVRVP